MIKAWHEALVGFSRWLDESGRAVATCEGYIKHVTWLADVAADPWALRSAELQAWMDAHHWSAQTRRKVLVSLRCFYAWGVAEGLCQWAPTAGLACAEPRKRGSRRLAVPPVWAEAISGFLLWQQSSSRSVGTLEQRRWWLGRLAEVCADPWAATPQQLATWLSTPDWSPETKRAGRASVRSFYRWAVLAGHLESSPADRLDSVLIARALPRPTPAAVLSQALAAADDRQRLAILLAAYAGLRRAEIAGLHTGDLGDTEILVRGKGGHQRLVPLHPDLADALRAEVRRRRQGTHGSGWRAPFATVPGWLFPSDLEDQPITPAHMGKLVRSCLPEGWTTHTLRHRFATAAYGATRDLRAVQELLGHAKPETTARYAAVPDGALRAAVAAVGV